MNKKLILIFLLSFFLRFFLSFKYTPLLWDEAALGYNAYSIIQTLHDEHGSFLPLIFKSFGDYKPGLYVYLSIPFVTFFGLNQTSIRLPSILLGSLTPILVYYLIKTIDFKKRKTAIISALILSVTPFHIHFSRGAWETNILTFELTLASLLFFKFFNTHKLRNLFLSSIIFGLSLYTYQSAKMISLLIIILLFSINIKKIIHHPKTIMLYFIIPLIILTTPIAFRLFSDSDSNRLQVLSIFSYPRTSSEELILQSYSTPLRYQLFNSNFIFFLRSSFERYFNHFSPYFLFTKGDWQNPRHSAIYTGILLIPSIIFLPLGLISIKSNSKMDRFFLIWLLLAPIPSALTRDLVSAVRSASLVIPLSYFTALGITKFLKRFKYFSILLITIFYLLSFIYYADLYLNHTAKTNPSDYLYGYHQAIEYLNKFKQKYQNIYLTDFYGQPYIFYLFYSQYPPKKYQLQNNYSSNSIDVNQIDQIDNIYFKTQQFNPDSTKDLIIYSKDEIWRQQLDKLEDFNDLFDPIGIINNQAQFYAYPKN